MILQTKRLTLRKLTTDDAFNFFNLNADQDVIKYTGDPPFNNQQAAYEFLSNYQKNNYDKYNYGRWAVILTETKEWLGWCGLKYSAEKKETDIGYRFYKKYWGDGYATESAKACLDYGFQTLRINRIVGRAMKDNIGSINVLKKIGMQYEKDILMDGKYPAVLYSTSKQ